MIKPGTLVHVDFLMQQKIGMFLSYDPIEKVPPPTLPTCNVLVGEKIRRVWIDLVKPVEEEK